MLLEYETNRLILKILSPQYAKDVLAFQENDRHLFEQYELDRYPDFYTVEHQEKILQCEYKLALKLSTVRFYVFLKDTPQTLIGTVCLYDISNTYSRCEIGYKFASNYHHHGYAYETLEKAIDIAFNDLHLHRICARVQETNTASIHLLENLGFEKEGVCRHHLKIHGIWTDHLQYSLLSIE